MPTEATYDEQGYRVYTGSAEDFFNLTGDWGAFEEETA